MVKRLQGSFDVGVSGPLLLRTCFLPVGVRGEGRAPAPHLPSATPSAVSSGSAAGQRTPGAAEALLSWVQ